MSHSTSCGSNDPDNVRRQAWSELGVSAPAMEDDALAPEVDRALLVRLIRGELEESTAESVHRLVLAFPSWRDAYATAAETEFTSRPRDA